jgi:hypothetical protein
MVEQGLEIKDTQAGSSLNVEITKLAKQHQEELRALEAKMNDAERRNDVKLQEMLAVERREKEKELARMQREQMAMERDRSEDMRRAAWSKPFKTNCSASWRNARIAKPRSPHSRGS